MVSISGKEVLKEASGFSLFLSVLELSLDKRAMNLRTTKPSKEIKWPYVTIDYKAPWNTKPWFWPLPALPRENILQLIEKWTQIQSPESYYGLFHRGYLALATNFTFLSWLFICSHCSGLACFTGLQRWSNTTIYESIGKCKMLQKQADRARSL